MKYDFLRVLHGFTENQSADQSILQTVASPQSTGSKDSSSTTIDAKVKKT